MASEQHHKGSARRTGPVRGDDGRRREPRGTKEKLDDDVDAILDEIDDVLEENAAEFVSSFVQKGGE